MDAPMTFAQRLRAEWAMLDGVLGTILAYRGLEADGRITVADDLERSVDRFPDNEAFRFEGRSLTYAEFDALANRFAHWGLAQGIKRDDVVALFMTTRPEFVACWMGLAKVGIVTALVNSNLAGGPLAHSINIANADHVIVSGDLLEAYLGVAAQLTREPKAWVQAGTASQSPPVHDLDAALQSMSADRPSPAYRVEMKSADVALYVYTSGTTGAPKAARMTHIRVMGMMRAFIGGGHAKPTDRVYVTLPLYHGTGGLCGVGFALERGGCVILRRKFSASHFWEECVEEGATVFFYIGELCRYLLNAPPHPLERAHRLRLGVGNGLRPDVWEEFQTRFGVPRMFEFYGSTEGNANLLNFDGRVGAVGRIPRWLRSSVRIRIVKFDLARETPVRGQDGLCIEAGVDEPGEAIGQINQDTARYKYEGYAGDKAQTEKKILRDVFEKGDAWFRTGDLLRRDKDNYLYFVDRIGDTFRWKGENVSTNEVGDALARFPGVVEANVYGVQVDGMEGRAGMAALMTNGAFKIDNLHEYLARELPPYARPIFLRLRPEIETTSTFKYRKLDLVREGFDATLVQDPIYFDDPRSGEYVPLTPALTRKLTKGEIKI
jgi:fatty-acyl-CoA synthase